jgi:hypothetical protein
MQAYQLEHHKACDLVSKNIIGFFGFIEFLKVGWLLSKQ